MISAVQKDSPAELAGLREQLVITAVDGQAVSDVTALAKQLYSKKSGDAVQFTVQIEQRYGPFTILNMQLFKAVVR